MNQFKIIGKYLDQPIITAKFSNAVPKILVGSAVGIIGYQALTEDNVQLRNKKCIKSACVLAGTIGSTLIATRGLRVGGAKIINGLSDVVKPQEVLGKNKRYIARFKKMIEKNPNIDSGTKELFKDKKIAGLLNKTTEKALNKSDIQFLYTSVEKNVWGKKLLNKIMPEPESVGAKDIWKELGRLSLLGAVPVAGGIIGGILGDRLTEKNWGSKIPDKIKEGAYQYLANIVLCNVGAGAALATLEGLKKANIIKKVSPTLRGFSMFAGIMITGVIGGSAIANYISHKLINPLFNKNATKNVDMKNLYNERHPEAIDVGLHIDDIATVGVMSGFAWIEPVLPLLYSISGHRAGIGYRNGENKHNHNQSPKIHNKVKKRRNYY